MPLNSIDIHEPYMGMGSDIPAAALPKSLCQSAVGFLPGRNGRLDLAPLLKRIQRNYGITIFGTAVWTAEHGVGDRLILVTTTKVYSLLLTSNVAANTAWKIDERQDGPHSYYELPASLTEIANVSWSTTRGVYSVQFGQELVISLAGALYRYYVDTGGLGTEKWYTLGLLTPPTTTISSQGTGGSLTLLQTYSYEVTWEDELGRESSPNGTVSVTLTGSNNAVTINRPTPGNAALGGATYWNVYRLNPGATIYKFVAQVAFATTTYQDTASDATVNANDSAPDDGENDPPWNTNGATSGPGTADILCVWKSRLVMNSSDDNRLQISNIDSPTQFSSLPLPTDLDDGVQVLLTAKGQNRITGLANLGSLLAIFTHDTTQLLYGDDISDFTIRETLQRGCINANSVQRTENEIHFLSDDGVYAIGYQDGYASVKKSIPIDDVFRGFKFLKKKDEPTSRWRWQDADVASSIFTNVTSFYTDNRYYLSIYDRTIVMDVRTGGWTDTGWGFVKTATRYSSAQEDYISTNNFALTSAPETIFLTLGDPTTWATELLYFTVADTPGDRDAPYTAKATLVMRPVGVEDDQRVRRKRVIWLSQFGKCGAERGEIIGKITWSIDGCEFGPVPIRAKIITKRQGALFEIGAPPVAGETIFATLEFETKQLSLEASVFEYATLN